MFNHILTMKMAYKHWWTIGTDKTFNKLLLTIIRWNRPFGYLIHCYSFNICCYFPSQILLITSRSQQLTWTSPLLPSDCFLLSTALPSSLLDTPCVCSDPSLGHHILPTAFARESNSKVLPSEKLYLISVYKLECGCVGGGGDGEMDRRLKAVTVVTKDRRLVPSTHIEWLTTVSRSSSGGFDALWRNRTDVHIPLQICR